MDYFENILKTILEHQHYWVRQSFKVELTKEEKRLIGKPSIPRPEIDLLAFRPELNEVLVIEAKSFLDSPGVRLSDLERSFEVPEGRYKLFTCDNYREIVFRRLASQLLNYGMINANTSLTLGLAAGNVYQNKSAEIEAFLVNRGWRFWAPEIIKSEVVKLANKGYENDAAIITAKILNR